MRFTLNIDVPAEQIEDADTSSKEIVRIMITAAEAVLAGALATTGDAMILLDSNGAEVGAATFEPSGFEVGDRVWDLTTGRKCVVAEVRDATGGHRWVTARDAITHEPRGTWHVDLQGCSADGRAWISRDLS